MAIRVLGFALALLLLSSPVTLALYEDQVGVTDWHQSYIGKVKSAIFHTQKAGRRRVVVSTEENVIASLDLRTGAIFWRHAFGSEETISTMDIALGKYVVTLSKEGSMLRAWNLPDGQMVWESILHVSVPTKTSLLSPTKVRKETGNLILVSAGGYLHAISSLDGVLVWNKNFSSESVEINQVYQSPDGDVIHALGFHGHSKVIVYQISAKNGEVLKEKSEVVPVKLSGESIQVSDGTHVALDATKTILVLVGFQGGKVTVRQKYISELVEDFSGSATVLPSKFNGMFSLKLDSFSVLLKVEGAGDFRVVERIRDPGLVSDAIFISEEQQALAVVQHDTSQIQLKFKLDKDIQNDFLLESVNVEGQRGVVHNVFINNYVRTDRSHGFRALLVMEDHSLLLVQQGEIVWSREDGLASIVDSTTSELPVEKVASVAKVEHNLMEWLKGHFLKLKETLMLANPEDVAALQGMRLKNSEKAKLTRDHNGFRKLLVLLTRGGKVYALHTGDGRIVWSRFSSNFRNSVICRSPVGLYIYPWQVPHHHALDENPSVMVVGRCEQASHAPSILAVLDSYNGDELSSLHADHNIVQVLPLPFMNSKEQRLYLMIDSSKNAHLYPRTRETSDIFVSELPNVFWYSIDSDQNIILGYSLNGNCVHNADEFCFSSRQLWSIVFPSESEKIIASTKRKISEVVHTQAKAIGDDDVMYKYISNNLLFVATSAPNGAGHIGSVAPEEAKIVSYIVDTVTGRILHRLTHHGAQGPVHAVFSENWVVYHYLNLRAHRFEMSVIEIYDQTRADNKDILKLALGKHNLTSPVSSYSWPEIVAKSQTFFFTHSVKVIAVTSTAKGITSKQLLIGTVGDQVLALDKRYLDPRRTANPSQSEKEEGIIPLTDSLPIIPQSYVTHSLQVEGLRGIVTVPAKLESTTLIFSYGIDLFFTQFAPSKTYDSLTEEFSYALLLLTIVALIAAIFITWVMSEQKELKERWR